MRSFWPVKWVAPAVLAWWTMQYSLTWTLVVGGFYYAVNLVLLLVWIIAKVQLALAGKPSLEDIFNEQLSRLMARYLVLCYTHRPSAPLSSVSPPREQRGNQEALVILDRVAANPPPVWRND